MSERMGKLTQRLQTVHSVGKHVLRRVVLGMSPQQRRFVYRHPESIVERARIMEDAKERAWAKRLRVFRDAARAKTAKKAAKRESTVRPLDQQGCTEVSHESADSKDDKK